MNDLHWLGKPIVSEDDKPDLEQRAAINEFGHKMPRHEAEAKAHEEYVREKRMDAAAHHLAGMRAAQGSGEMQEARKHGALYEMHMQALGLDHMGPVPAEIQARIGKTDQKVYKFKAHKGDLFALDKKPEPVTKSESFSLQKVAPPGMSEDAMLDLKNKHGAETASKIAWSAYNSRKDE